eukprot:UN05021
MDVDEKDNQIINALEGEHEEEEDEFDNREEEKEPDKHYKEEETTPFDALEYMIHIPHRPDWSLQERTLFCQSGHQLPSLFVVGIQKAGTTTLSYQLRYQTGMDFGKHKEHRFFNRAATYMKSEHQKELLADQFPECDHKKIHNERLMDQFNIQS